MSEHRVLKGGSGATHIGRREHNEDTYLIDVEQGLAVVADGVGGHQAGEVASAITCEVILRELVAGRSVEQGIRSANREVMAAVAQGRGKSGMASTVVAARFSDSDYELAWVGDSRCYLWDGQLKLLTRDHSYVQALLAKGQITLAQARNHPRKNVIVQAVGLQEDTKLQVGINGGRLAPGQVLLLCSDGLSDVVDSAQMSEILSANAPLAVRCQTLVDAAVQAGGKDNITVVLLPGAEPKSGLALLEPDVLWSYDPKSGDYTGLPELEEEFSGEAAAVPIPAVRRVASRQSDGTPGEQLQSTQMLSASDIEAARKAAKQEQEQGRRSSRWLFALVVAALIVGSVAYSLDIIFRG